LGMDALGCQVAVSLMILSPSSNKGTKSTRIPFARQILRTFSLINARFAFCEPLQLTQRVKRAAPPQKIEHIKFPLKG
ncbi:hypothetical protein M8368_34385, partial [Enterobacter kobei]|nr:hypothetical protein [Enterobacter kobei]